MGRNKNKQYSASTDNGNLDNTVSMNVDDETIEEATATSSNLHADADDKTSADYYFDSYSHFGINPSL